MISGDAYIYIYTHTHEKKGSERNKAHNDTWQHMKKGKIYLQLEPIKQYGAGGKSILLVLRLKKKEKKKKISGQNERNK